MRIMVPQQFFSHKDVVLQYALAHAPMHAYSCTFVIGKGVVVCRQNCGCPLAEHHFMVSVRSYHSTKNMVTTTVQLNCN